MDRGEREMMIKKVDKAIESVLAGGQSYRIEDRSLTRADLAMLKALKDDLEAKAAAEDDGPFLGGVWAAFFEGR